MKNLFLTLCLLCIGFWANAQRLDINNRTGCTWNLYLYATKPGCDPNARYVSQAISIAPYSSITFNGFGSVPWMSGTPTVGFIWDEVRIINPCMTNLNIGYSCSAGYDGIGLATGQGCHPPAMNSCADVTVCGSCNNVYGFLTPGGGPNDWRVDIQ